jgi:hypothetical protein
MNETATMTQDLDRLAERIEKAAAMLQAQRAERERLERENAQLAARLREVEERLQGQDAATLIGELNALRREQREWQSERRDVALRIEELARKLERLED